MHNYENRQEIGGFFVLNDSAKSNFTLNLLRI